MDNAIKTVTLGNVIKVVTYGVTGIKRPLFTLYVLLRVLSKLLPNSGGGDFF